MSPPSAGIRRILYLLLLVHLLLAIQRLPGKVYRRRADHLEQIRAKGYVDFFLGDDPPTAKSVQWLLDNTPADSVILIRGSVTGGWQGDLELANALLHPRLLYSEPAAPPGATELYGRRIARGTLIGQGTGTLVLLDDGKTLQLGLR